MLSYRRKTPTTIILDTPVLAGVIVGALLLSVLSFLVGRWTAGSPEPASEQSSVLDPEIETQTEPIPVRQASSIEGDLSFLDRIERDKNREPSARPAVSPPREPAETVRPATEETSPPPSRPQAASKTPPTTTPKPTLSPEPAQAADASPPPPPDTSGWIIQVFASELESRARELQNRLVQKGYPARVISVQMKAKSQPEAKTYYRVRVGPYASKTTANSVADRLKAEEKLSTWIFNP